MLWPPQPGCAGRAGCLPRCGDRWPRNAAAHHHPDMPSQARGAADWQTQMPGRTCAVMTVQPWWWAVAQDAIGAPTPTVGIISHMRASTIPF